VVLCALLVSIALNPTVLGSVPLFEEDFDDPASGWVVVDNGAILVRYSASNVWI